MFRIFLLSFPIISGGYWTLQTHDCYRSTGNILHGEYMENFKLTELYSQTVYQCIQLCLSWTLCRSVNFHTKKNTCELNCMGRGETYGSMDTKDNYIYSDITYAPSMTAGQCDGHTCAYDSLCIPGIPDGYRCVPIFSSNNEIEKIYSRKYDFESCLCGWKQDSEDDGNWILKQGGTITTHTGPSADHTTGNGTYIYMEASYRPQNHTIRLISDQLPATYYTFISFWYHMWSNRTDKMGTLNMYIQNDDSLPDLVFSVTGNQGQEWKNEEIVLYNQPSVFVIIFEAIRGAGTSSDICIDDININIS